MSTFIRDLGWKKKIVCNNTLLFACNKKSRSRKNCCDFFLLSN